MPCVLDGRTSRLHAFEKSKFVSLSLNRSLSFSYCFVLDSERHNFESRAITIIVRSGVVSCSEIVWVIQSQGSNS